jgi:thiol-disulfide isomerase/thioredoxin
MVSRRRLLGAGLAVAGAAAVAYLARFRGSTPTRGEDLALGVAEFFPPGQRRDAPAVTGELLDGTPFDLADWYGQVVVINWWGSWCAPCRAEAPELREVYEATRDLGVEFLGVDVRDGRDAAIAFQDAFEHAWPSLFDPGGRIAMDFRDVQPNVVPTTLLLDRAHQVAAVFRKAIRRYELEDAVRDLAEEDVAGEENR